MNIIENLRDYIKALKDQGQLVEINQEVDPHLEVGGIIKKANDQRGPAILFNKLTGFRDGFRILGSPATAWNKPNMTYSRVATSLGLPPDSSPLHIIENLSRINDLAPLKPKEVRQSACKENKYLGDEVDLSILPSPYLHDGDGGLYLGTWPIVITKSADEDWVNWGMYRIMVHDKKTLGGPLIPSQHIGMHYATWKARNEPMPFAIALGTDPLSPIIASMAIAPHVSEADLIGAYRQKPVEVIKCETNDLYVPASAEIVVEGFVSMDDSRLEGPFAEYTGFLLKSRKSWPVFKVTAITHRHNPILPVVCAGEPIDDHLSMSISLAAGILNLLKKSKVPVKSAFVPPCSALHLLVISVYKDRYQGTDQQLIDEIAKVVWSDKAGTFLPKVMVVDQDIDITDTENVMWAFSTHCHPQTGFHFYPDMTIIPLSPYLTPEEKKSGKSTTVIYDSTFNSQLPPENMPVRATFEALWPKEIQEKINKNWAQYGF